MQLESENSNQYCSKLNAFLDGELLSDDVSAFETHLNSCESCSTEVELHRSLEIDIDTLPPEAIEIPKDFSRVVAVKAESQVSGLRKSSERSATFKIVASLGVILLLLLGSSVGAATGFLTFLFDRIVSVLSVIGSFIFNLLLGIFVILRVATTRFEFDSTSFLFLSAIAVLILAMAILFRFGLPSFLRDIKR
jgi:hypothetical protein